MKALQCRERDGASRQSLDIPIAHPMVASVTVNDRSPLPGRKSLTSVNSAATRAMAPMRNLSQAEGPHEVILVKQVRARRIAIAVRATAILSAVSVVCWAIQFQRSSARRNRRGRRPLDVTVREREV